MENPLLIERYKRFLTTLHRGKGKEGYSNAKPILLLSLMDMIESGKVTDNRFTLTKELERFYRRNFMLYNPDSPVTQIFFPFYHLQFDMFWNFHYPPQYQHAEYRKSFFNQEGVYASLDNALWDLLQDGKIRAEFKQLVIDKYLQKAYKQEEQPMPMAAELSDHEISQIIDNMF